ncbi:MAG: leucine-rich repeat domain-containing protein, partial [Muribaculaceae bacterium]|nr:leucine-rich repeat domain-containing protein [Muribaculaceae bacterium]
PEIKNYIFEYAKIDSLKLSDSVKRIGVKTFAASELRTVDLGNGINTIDDMSFANCKNLYEVSFGNSLKKIGTESFKGCTALNEAILPESLEEIGLWAFQDCSNMTSLLIPKSVQYFGGGAFSCCGRLQTVEIENGVPFIPSYCFEYCKNLSSITLPETLVSIGACAFSNCVRIRSVKLSEKMVFVGEKAFENCTDLQEVSCYATNPPICQDDAFLNSHPEYMILRVPKGTKDRYATSKGWKDFGRIIDDLEVAGIEGITVPEKTITIDYDLPYTVYAIDGALAGTSIELLSPGIYIVRQGQKSVKTVIK